MAQFNTSRRTRCLGSAVLSWLLLSPGAAHAQPGDRWQIEFVPLYFWATELSGSATVRERTVPIFLEFADAADNLGGAFSFHVGANKGRWGLLSDLYFVRLSSDAQFTLPNRAVAGEFDLDNTIFEVAGTYAVRETVPFAVMGGLRTYTLSPKFELTATGVEPVDASETSADVFGGFLYRPKLSDKWTLLTRADIGGGSAELTWSALVGVEYRFRPWGGLLLGYKALGIDWTGDADAKVDEYDVTHYGPAFGLSMHWGGR